MKLCDGTFDNSDDLNFFFEILKFSDRFTTIRFSKKNKARQKFFSRQFMPYPPSPPKKNLGTVLNVFTYFIT